MLIRKTPGTGGDSQILMIRHYRRRHILFDVHIHRTRDTTLIRLAHQEMYRQTTNARYF